MYRGSGTGRPGGHWTVNFFENDTVYAVSHRLDFYYGLSGRNQGGVSILFAILMNILKIVHRHQGIKKQKPSLN